MDCYNSTDKEVRTQLESAYAKANDILNDYDKLEEFLQRLEKKLKEIPNLEEPLSNIPIMISVVRSYVKKEYTDITTNKIIFIVFALVYFVSPFDLIPEFFPVLAFFKDVAVIEYCRRFVKSDIEEYIRWQD